jgi:cobyrinic acid a,c-diamide synthase
VAAALAEIAISKGLKARYHHLGALPVASAWDRWEGAAFLDPALYDETSLVALYDVATRGSALSLLSSYRGVLDRNAGVDWLPRDVAKILDCPIVLVMDCRGWGTGIRAIVAGMNSQLGGLNLAGAILTGVEDNEHYELLRSVLAREGVTPVGCLYRGEGPSWDAEAPGPWQLPLDPDLVETVGKQVDIDEIQQIANQRGFLSSPVRLTDRGAEGPLIVVAGGKGFTPWSRDSIEVLRADGAQIRRLDLTEDQAIPEEASGLILAGTAWPSGLSDIARNRTLLADINTRVKAGLPTIAMGGGMFVLLRRLQDSMGRTVELSDLLPAEGEIAWDLDDAAYVQITAEKDNVLLNHGETVTGWVGTEAEIQYPDGGWHAPFAMRAVGAAISEPEGAASSSLLCSRAFIHFMSNPEMGRRFVSRCALYGARRGVQNSRAGSVG